MLYTQLILGTSMLANLGIGIAVFFANSRRAQNRQFLLFSAVMSVWGFIVLGIVGAQHAQTAGILIRFASYFSALIPVSFHLLCLAIATPDAGMRSLFYRARHSFVASQIAGLMCFMPYFLSGVTLHPGADSAVTIEAHYGAVYAVYALYYPIVMGWIVFNFVRSMKKATGLQREEFKFILLGMSVTVLIGMTTNAILPAITGSSASQPFGPISIVAMDAIIAYGIATRRIMDVAYVLRRTAAYALVTVYLVLLYGGVWFAVDMVSSRFLPINWPVAHLLAAIALAFSVAPAHGLMQRFANRLFVTRQTMDVGSTVGELNDMLLAIRTLPNLLQRFSQTIGNSVGTESLCVLLRNHTGFEQQFPPPSESDLHRMQGDDPLVLELEASRDAIVADELSRLRPTPQIKAISGRLTDLHAAVAVGIRTPDQLEGLLLLGPKRSGSIYGVTEINALPILCDQLAVALENAELYTQTRDGKIYNDVLLDNLTSGIIAANEEGRVTVINREAQRITGLQPRDVLEQPFSTLPSALAEALAQTLRTGRVIRDQDAVLDLGDEQATPIRLGSSAFTGHTGNLLGVLVVFTDLTTVKKLETQVRRTDRLASIGTLAAGMAHEIKNPLVTVKTFTQLLPDRYQDEDFRRTFSTLIGQEVRRIDGIVNQLLEFARPAKPDLAPIRLHDVVERCLRLLEQQMRQKGIDLDKNLTEESDSILGDANLLEQAFVNFLLNAIDSMDDGGRLTVATDLLRYNRRTHEEYDSEHGPRRIRLTIRDTGVGIRPDDVSHIFDPFYTTKSQGTGLGLSVSHGIIQDHGGDIEVESTPGQGTVFHIVFPIRVAEVMA